MCDCIEDANKMIKENYEDPEASINVGFSFKANSLSVKPSGLAASYRKKKKDGTYSAKKTQISIVPTFCPFCGIKYEEETNAD